MKFNQISKSGILGFVLLLSATTVVTASDNKLSPDFGTAPPYIEANILTYAHQYRWSDWLTLNDGKLNGMQFSFRKGDNDFIERGMVFVRLYNRYKGTVSGDVDFVIVNESTGARSGGQSAPFYMRAESLDEDSGNWFLAPVRDSSPEEWARSSLSLEQIRIRNFRVDNN